MGSKHLFAFVGFGLLVAAGSAARAEPPGNGRFAEAVTGTSSAAARQEAIADIPFDKLDRSAQAKARSVLSNVTIFRRMPIRVVDCDPDLYLFLVRHPDVVVGVWQALKMSQLELHQVDDDTFQAVESDGTTIAFEYLYKSHDLHIVYAEGTYTGSLLQRSVKGSCLCVLRSGYVRETDGRYYVTNRMDAFLNVEPGAIEIVTRTLQPIATRVADNNMVQSIAFVGSLSKTAEVNPEGMERLATRLECVRPEIRDEFALLSLRVAQKAAANAVSTSMPPLARAPRRLAEAH